MTHFTRTLTLSLLLAILSLSTTACGLGAGGTALYAGLTAASLAGGGAMWYMAGEEQEALGAKQTHIQEALDSLTYEDCDALKDHVEAVMIEKGYSYSYESKSALHISDWDYFSARYDDKWNKIQNAGRRRMLFEVAARPQGCQLTASTQTLFDNAPEANKTRSLDLEMAVLQRVDPQRLATIEQGATAAYTAKKESDE